MTTGLICVLMIWGGFLLGILVMLAVEWLRDRDEQPEPRANLTWLRNPSHSARASDHNPGWCAGGVVRAWDIVTETATPIYAALAAEELAAELAAELDDDDAIARWLA